MSVEASITEGWNRVVVDLSRHPDVAYAVIWEDRLLPIRFATQGEAADHLFGLRHGTIVMSPRLPKGIEPGRSLNVDRAT